jgi:hypothetical protein
MRSFAGNIGKGNNRPETELARKMHSGKNKAIENIPAGGFLLPMGYNGSE